MGKHAEYTIYAVDFDGTLCMSRFPKIGEPNRMLIKWLIHRRKTGDKLILWTNRTGSLLEEAVNWCGSHGLEFDAVNENLPEMVEKYAAYHKNGPGPKITVDVFIDDLSCNAGLPFDTPDQCSMNDCWNLACERRNNWTKKVCKTPDLSLTDLGLSPSVCIILNNHKIRSLYTLLTRTEQELGTIPGIDIISIQEIHKVLKQHGLTLRDYEYRI